MALIYRPESTEMKIELKEVPNEFRPYLGMSGIGHECSRAIWYGFHWAATEMLTARKQRIFDRGDLEEARIIRDLTSVGIVCYRTEPDGTIVEITGEIGEKQQTLTGFENHAKGHPDGTAIGVIEAPKTPHLLEFKTAAAKYFANYVKEKSVQKVSPVYYAQAQRYMAAMKLTRALFIATNKDTEARYYERIKFDKDAAGLLIEKERNIILSDGPPPKAFNKTWITCKWCKFNQVCHYNAAPEVKLSNV